MCFCQYKIRFVLPDQRDEKLPLASKKTLFLLQEKESKDGPPPQMGDRAGHQPPREVGLAQSSNHTPSCLKSDPKQKGNASPHTPKYQNIQLSKVKTGPLRRALKKPNSFLIPKFPIPKQAPLKTHRKSLWGE